MTIIILLIGISLTIAAIFLVVFFWNMKNGQYDDTYTPSVRMLFDETKKRVPAKDKIAEKAKDKSKKTSD